MRFRYILYKLLYRHYQSNKQHYISLLHFISNSVYMIIYYNTSKIVIYMIIYCNISNIIIYIKLELRWSGLQSIISVMR